MAFHFIHTGDWHIAKPFGRFDADKAALLREARARIVDRVGGLARQRGAEAVLVAGDVFDGPLVADGVLRKLAARLEQFADIQWHFLPGNHDPATANGVWQRFANIVGGAHVIVHHEAGVRRISDKVDLLAAPLHNRAIAHDPTAWMAGRESDAGVIRIGLAHGAVQGFGSAGEASVLIAPDRAVSARLDYLALGDWHGVRQAGPKAWYAGTPEPDQFPENEPGYALSVKIAGPGGEPEVGRHRLAHYDWQRHELSGDLFAAIDGIERALSGVDGKGLDVLLRVQVTGRISLEDEILLRERIERLGDLAFHVEAGLDQLAVDAGDLAGATFSDPLIASVGGRLAAAMADGGETGEIAHQALILLTRHAREQEGRA
jgi:DNA repair exonuclease SbcCD nuclease subunit